MNIHQCNPVTIAVGAAVTTQVLSSALTPSELVGRPLAKIREIKVTIPNYTYTETFTFALIDSQSITRYSISGLAKNASTILLVDRSIGENYKYGVTPSGATGTDISVSIYTDIED